MSDAERRAVARENAAKRKAGQRYLDQARTLQGQAAALRLALSKTYKQQLNQQLADVGQILGQQQDVLMAGYKDRVKSLAGAAKDNAKAEANQSTINAQNSARERTSALQQAVTQGAGESDLMQSQMMSLRNWQANQAEVQRGFFDTLRSINSSLTDLNVDTKTARINNVLDANADREQLWTDYYNRRSETLTNLGNTYGQIADYRESAQEYGVGGGGGKASKQARRAWMAASRAMGQSWDNPGVGKKLRRWDGRDEFKSAPASVSHLRAAQTVSLGGEKPEGATLREW